MATDDEDQDVKEGEQTSQAPGPCPLTHRRPVNLAGPSPSHECLHGANLVKGNTALDKLVPAK